jgi:hypothetical protein
MRKVIVFKVENVLVNGFDERRNDEVNAKRVVRELVWMWGKIGLRRG